MSVLLLHVLLDGAFNWRFIVERLGFLGRCWILLLMR
jgi:hypothetical protein